MVVVPLAMTVLLSFHDWGQYKGIETVLILKNWREIWSDSYFHEMFLRTLRIAGLATLITVVYKTLPDVRIRWRDVLLGAGVSALMFVLGKHAVRRQLVTNVSREDHVAYLYSSLSGCDATRLIFDGSGFIAVDGQVDIRRHRNLYWCEHNTNSYRWNDIYLEQWLNKFTYHSKPNSDNDI